MYRFTKRPDHVWGLTEYDMRLPRTEQSGGEADNAHGCGVKSRCLDSWRRV